MNKRITSLLLCFVMVFAMSAIAVPALAAGGTCTYSIKADKTTAAPGDTINFTIYMQQTGKQNTLEGTLVIPSGLTFVANSGKITDGVAAKLGWTGAGEGVWWTPIPKMLLNGFGAESYTGTEKFSLMTFQCTVDSNATAKDYQVKLIDLVADDENYETKNPTCIPATITVTAVSKPATDIALNKSELTLTAGDSDTSLTATVTPADSTDTVVWSTNKPEVATVDSATGKVTAVAPGEATITATAGTKTATCTVKVQAAPCAHGSFTLVPEEASNCTEKGWDAYKKCDLCGKLFDMSDNLLSEIPYRALNDDHDFNTSEWGYKEADGHAHVCNRNAAHHDTVVSHTAGPVATETTPQTCTECGFVMQAATGHVHADHLTKIDRQEATCTVDGNKEYYECTCGKFFEDAAANVEITDHSSVVLPKTGHSYTVQNSDEAHKRSTAADCREFDTYWYTCANDANHSAKDDPAAADKFYNGEQGAHVYGTEWIDRGEAGHAHKCQYHDAYDAVHPHTPDHEGGATYDYAVKCSDCHRVMEPQLEVGNIRIEVPFKLTVKKTGEMAPGKETFKFVIEDFGATTDYVLIQDTIETEGEKTYKGKFVFTIKENQAGNLSEGFVIRQAKGNAKGWTYDETKFYAIPIFVDSYTNVAGWTFCKFDENGELDYRNPIEEIGFTNSYSAKKPVTPPAPKNPPAPKKSKTPKTGDSSGMSLWITLLLAAGATVTGTTLYSRKKRENNR